MMRQLPALDGLFGAYGTGMHTAFRIFEEARKNWAEQQKTAYPHKKPKLAQDGQNGKNGLKKY